MTASYKFVISSLFFICFFSNSAHSEQPKAAPLSPNNLEINFSTKPTSLVNMTAMPSSIVNGCVNVITGDYCIAGLDHSVSGPDPFPLGHTYFSSSLKDGTLGNGWNFFHNHLLQVFQSGKITFNGEDSDSSFYTDHENSSLSSTPESPADLFFYSTPEELDDEDSDSDEYSSGYYPPHPRIPIYFGDASHHDHHRDNNDNIGGGVSMKTLPLSSSWNPQAAKSPSKANTNTTKLQTSKSRPKIPASPMLQAAKSPAKPTSKTSSLPGIKKMTYGSQAWRWHGKALRAPVEEIEDEAKTSPPCSLLPRLSPHQRDPSFRQHSSL